VTAEAGDLWARFRRFQERRPQAVPPAAAPAPPCSSGQPAGEEFRLLPGAEALFGSPWPARVAGSDLGPGWGWRWLDLETTGLRGVGARPFAAAIGRRSGDGVLVRQYLLRDLADERAFVGAILDELADATAVVTFNGKAFDWPVLRDRAVALGLGHRWRELPHWDVLFAARRVWGERLGTCELGRLLEAVLGEPREGEPPGDLVPALYQAFLLGDGDAIAGVLRRNRHDVWGLVGLAAALVRLLDAGGAGETDPRVLLGLGREYERVGERERALAAYARCEASSTDLVRRRAARARAALLKRLGRREEAAAVWDAERRGPWPSVEAAVELAKHLEHHRRDPAAALRVVQEALAIPWLPPARRAELERRAARLRAKAARRRGPSLQSYMR
jgi:tetratricopeptide (TPR) repeat protein